MTPDRQPVLEGERVRLRPSTADDWEALYAVARDPLIWEVHPAHDRWREDVFRAYFDGGIASGGALTIIDRANGAVIGSSRFDNWDAEAGEIEIGWTYLARSHWGGTYNREIKRLMVGHILRYVPTVVLTVGAYNVRSRRAVEKLGAVLRPGLHDRLMAGAMTPHVIYALRSVPA